MFTAFCEANRSSHYTISIQSLYLFKIFIKDLFKTLIILSRHCRDIVSLHGLFMLIVYFYEDFCMLIVYFY